MSNLKECDEYLDRYPFNALNHIVKTCLGKTLVAKTTSDKRAKPLYVRVLDIKKHEDLKNFVLLDKFGWVRPETCTFKLR